MSSMDRDTARFLSGPEDVSENPVESQRANRAEIEASAAVGYLLAALQQLDRLEKEQHTGLLKRTVGEETYDDTQLSQAIGRARDKVRTAYKGLVYANGLFD